MIRTGTAGLALVTALAALGVVGPLEARPSVQAPTGVTKPLRPAAKPSATAPRPRAYLLYLDHDRDPIVVDSYREEEGQIVFEKYGGQIKIPREEVVRIVPDLPVAPPGLLPRAPGSPPLREGFAPGPRRFPARYYLSLKSRGTLKVSDVRPEGDRLRVIMDKGSFTVPASEVIGILRIPTKGKEQPEAWLTVKREGRTPPPLPLEAPPPAPAPIPAPPSAADRRLKRAARDEWPTLSLAPPAPIPTVAVTSAPARVMSRPARDEWPAPEATRGPAEPVPSLAAIAPAVPEPPALPEPPPASAPEPKPRVSAAAPAPEPTPAPAPPVEPTPPPPVTTAPPPAPVPRVEARPQTPPPTEPPVEVKTPPPAPAPPEARPAPAPPVEPPPPASPPTEPPAQATAALAPAAPVPAPPPASLPDPPALPVLGTPADLKAAARPTQPPSETPEPPVPRLLPSVSSSDRPHLLQMASGETIGVKGFWIEEGEVKFHRFGGVVGVALSEVLKLVPEKPESQEERVPVRLARVVSPTVLEVRVKGASRLVRLLGIEASDGLDRSREPWRRLQRGAVLRLEFDREMEEADGTWLAYVFLPNGRMLNAELVKLGLARPAVDPRGLKYLDLFHELDSLTGAAPPK